MPIESSQSSTAFQATKDTAPEKTTTTSPDSSATWGNGRTRTVFVLTPPDKPQEQSQLTEPPNVPLQERTATTTGPTKSILKKNQSAAKKKDALLKRFKKEDSQKRVSHDRQVTFNETSTVSDGEAESVGQYSTKNSTKDPDNTDKDTYSETRHRSGLSSDTRAGINTALEESGARGLENWLSTGLAGSGSKVLLIQNWLEEEGKLDDISRDICKQAFCCEVAHGYIDRELDAVIKEAVNDKSMSRKKFLAELNELQGGQYFTQMMIISELEKLGAPKNLSGQITKAAHRYLEEDIAELETLWSEVVGQRLTNKTNGTANKRLKDTLKGIDSKVSSGQITQADADKLKKPNLDRLSKIQRDWNKGHK